MAESPLIFDRALIRARRRRAVALGPATFLLDRLQFNRVHRNRVRRNHQDPRLVDELAELLKTQIGFAVCD